MPMFFVYVIRSLKDGRFYTGQTNDFERRLMEHNTGQGLVRYTKNKGPWVVVLVEEFSTRSAAVKREKYLKTGVGRDFIKSLGK